MAQDDTATCDYDDPDWSNPCVSYGVDFQDQGSYFQNISSTDPFTFVSFFEGCQPDVCDNILVDPYGDEYLCSNTNLNPDDSNQMSTCPMDKDQLWSGDWSVILISNNGDACPIAYERDFYLTVAEPVTTTFTPTVSLTAIVTPVTNITSVTTTTNTVTSTSTVTSAKKTLSPTTTITPHPVTSTKVVTMGTVRKTKYTAVPTLTTKTVVQTCSIPPKQRSADPFCTITPTLVHAAALSTASASPTTKSSARRRDNMRRVPADRAARIAERKARLAAARLEKRGLDVATTTVTDTNTLDYVTTTSTSTAPASTMTITSQATTTSTVKTTTTVLSGTTVLAQVTVTAPTPTKTHTKYTVVTSTVATITKHPTITITAHTAPAQSTIICYAKGGKMWPA